MGRITQRRPFMHGRRARSLFGSAWTHLSDHQVLFLPSKRKKHKLSDLQTVQLLYISIDQSHGFILIHLADREKVELLVNWQLFVQ